MRKTAAGVEEGSRELVMHCNEAARAQLDESMAQLGYEFDCIVEDKAPAVAFPVASSGASATDRPTPVMPPPQAAALTRVPETSVPAAAERSDSAPPPSPAAESVAAAIAALPKPAPVVAAPRTFRDVSGLERSFLLFVPLLSLTVQGFVLNSDFKHDDFLHFYDGVAQTFWDFVLAPHGGHVMVFHKAVYWAFHRIFGLFAFPYFLLVWITHGANVALLHAVLRRLTDRPAIAALFAAGWGMAPVHQATIGWFATYGQMLVATAVLWVLLDLAGCVRRNSPPSTGTAVRWAFLLLFAAGNFGMGIAIAASFPVVAWLLLPKGGRGKAFGIATFTALSTIALYKVLAGGGGAAGFGKLGWGLVVWVSNLAKTFAALSVYGVGTSVLGWVVTVTKEAERHSAVLSSAGVFSVLAVGAGVSVLRSTTRRDVLRRAVALSLLSAAAYGATALGRTGGLASSSEWTATQSRYHYAAPLGFLLAAGVCLAQSMRQRSGPRWLEPLAATALVAFAVSNYRTSEKLFDENTLRNRALAKHVAQQFEDLATGTSGPDEVYVANASFQPVALILKLGVPLTRFPRLAGFFAITHPDGTIDGKRIRFVESDQDLVKGTREQQAPVNALLVGEAEVKADTRVVRVDLRAPGSKAAENDMVKALRESRDPKVRAQVARASRESRDPEIRAKLVRQLRESKDPKVRAELERALREGDDPKVRAGLERALRKSRPEPAPSSE